MTQQTEAITRIEAVDPATLKTWLDSGQAVLVDVREPAERARERIPGSGFAPLSGLDPSSLADGDGKKLVLHCKGGTRSQQACRKLLASLSTDVWYLDGGIEQWKDAGHETLVSGNGRGVVDVQRQVQIVLGAMVAALTALGAFASPVFLIVPGAIGLGLFTAGVTGRCPLALLIARMPWNQRGAGCQGATCCSGT